ncbi:FAD binding domain-containing protein [Escherichia sp. HC-CC]
MIEQFFRPDSVEQALELKRRYQDEAVWFAGGSKLNATPTRTDKKIAISLQDLELDWVDWDNGALRIGAMSRLQPLRDARFIPAALREALGFVYSRHVRNQSTIGGEIAVAKNQFSIQCQQDGKQHRLFLAGGDFTTNGRLITNMA